MSPRTTPGEVALESGRAAVEHMMEIFWHKEYAELSPNNKKLLTGLMRGGRKARDCFGNTGPMVVSRFTGLNSIYGVPYTLDAFAWHPEKYPDGLAIKIKWQSTGGSVDEKFPFVINSLEALGIPSIFILDGGHYRSEAEAWVHENRGRVDTFGSIGEFFKWGRENL